MANHFFTPGHLLFSQCPLIPAAFIQLPHSYSGNLSTTEALTPGRNLSLRTSPVAGGWKRERERNREEGKGKFLFRSKASSIRIIKGKSKE